MGLDHVMKAGFVVTAAVVLFLGLERPVQARGTHFVAELSGGLATSPYEQDAWIPAMGVSLGATWKLPRLSLRWYLLGTFSHRSREVSGSYRNDGFRAQREEYDLYGASRFVLPVWRSVRVYGEVGIGRRFYTQRLSRASLPQNLSEESSAFLLVLAAGLSVRVASPFSVGLRAELTPLTSQAGLPSYAVSLFPRARGGSMLAQIGIHF